MPGRRDGAVPRPGRFQLLRWVVADPGLEQWAAFGAVSEQTRHRLALVRHTPGQFPYLAVQLDGGLVHAQEIAWYEQRVMIRYPLQITDAHHFSRPVICWVNRSETYRIAREDSSWHDPQDDIDWHEIEDDSL